METPPPDAPFSSASPTPPFNVWQDLGQRFFSSLVLVAVFLVAEVIGGFLFAALIIAAALIMIREWDNLTVHRDRRWYWGGVAYITIPCAFLLWLRDVAFIDSPQAGMGIVLYLILVVAATDIGAYFTGKHIGGPKLAPAISPGKTWAGLAGGVAAAGVAGFLCAIFTPYPTSPFAGLVIGMLLAFVAQGGDLFESWMKRKAGVKNSGELIPGHGGMLDRVDGLLTATPVLALCVLLSGYAV